ncbi:response regulator [Derxia lacustris]|uniref:response regulator n=1 Tax=Derxia lacustris TaxID=764842 RepID=UPI000A16FAAD|nr:response regulator [Derxia lacustris]
MTDAQDSKPHILVVDDDRLVLATLVNGLTDAGFHVTETDNGDDAILLAREVDPDIALLDMRMNGLSGMDVARYLKAHTGVPFMFLSAFGDPEIVSEATALGALGYLVKPLEIKQIVPAIRAALGRAAEQRQRREPRAADAAGLPDLDLAAQAVAERHRLDLDTARVRIAEQAAALGCPVEQLAAQLAQAVRLIDSLAR